MKYKRICDIKQVLKYSYRFSNLLLGIYCCAEIDAFAFTEFNFHLFFHLVFFTYFSIHVDETTLLQTVQTVKLTSVINDAILATANLSESNFSQHILMNKKQT